MIFINKITLIWYRIVTFVSYLSVYNFSAKTFLCLSYFFLINADIRYSFAESNFTSCPLKKYSFPTFCSEHAQNMFHNPRKRVSNK